MEQALNLGVSRAVLARLLGITGARLDGWRRQGLPRTGTGRFLVREWFTWFEQRTAVAAATQNENSEESLARFRRARAGREELLLARDRGELVDRDHVVEFTTRAIAAVRARMSDLVRKVAVRCHQSPSIEATEELLQHETDEICAMFAHGLMHPDDSAAPVPDVPVAVQQKNENDNPPADAGITENEEP